MKAKVIKTTRESKAAMERIEENFDSKPRTPEGDELELLTSWLCHSAPQLHVASTPLFRFLFFHPARDDSH